MTRGGKLGSSGTRAAALDAAYELMTTRGYHGVSMRDIAAAAGVRASSLYNHFASKEEIVETVILERHPYVRLAPQLAQLEADSAEGLIRALAQRVVAEFEASPGLLELMMIELSELRGAHLPKLLPQLMTGLEPVLARIEALGGERLIVAPTVLLRGLSGVLLSHLLVAGGAQLSVDLDEVLQLLFHGAFAKEAS